MSLIMQIEEVGRPVIGFEDGQIFGVQMLVPTLSRVQCEQERIIRIVGIQQLEISQIEVAVARVAPGEASSYNGTVTPFSLSHYYV